MAAATKTGNTTTPPSAPEEGAKGPAVVKVGNLTSDPELRYSPSGKAYVRMRLAVSSPKVPGDWAGERATVFYDVTAFGSLAEHAAESLSKGTRVLVSGRGEVRKWTDDKGQERSGKGILADALGPDLRWATATVARASQSKAIEAEPSDAAGGDEEPF